MIDLFYFVFFLAMQSGLSQEKCLNPLKEHFETTLIPDPCCQVDTAVEMVKIKAFDHQWVPSEPSGRLHDEKRCTIRSHVNGVGQWGLSTGSIGTTIFFF